MADDNKPEPTSFAVVSWSSKDAPGKRYLQITVFGPIESVQHAQRHFDKLITSFGSVSLVENPSLEDVKLLMSPVKGKAN